MCACQAMILMEHNLTQRVTLGEIAQEIDTSLGNLERKFVSAHGVSPTTYFRDLRIRHAQWMLDHTQKQIGQIADQCGFVDAAHFCRCFKAVFGTTPSTYQSRMGG